MAIIDPFPEHEEVIDSNSSVASKACTDTGDEVDFHEFVSDSIKTWKPDCADDKKPFLRQVFPNLDVAFEFYKEYGRASGFDIRRSTQKVDKKGNIWLKYFVCSNAGFYEGSAAQKTIADSDDNNVVVEFSNTRKRTASTKCGCRARIVLRKFGVKGFAIKTFIEEHNHKLAADRGKQFLRCNRSLTFVHKQFILDAAKSNIGATRAHGIFKAMVGSYSNIGATSVDFKKFSRDIKQYIGKHDADMILQKFKDKNETSDNLFRYEYQTDSNNHLTRLFWADGLGRRSYDVFGDVLGTLFCAESKFMEKLNKFVWSDHSSPVEFEEGWKAVIAEFELSDNSWLSEMYELRNSWIPAYFNEDPMAGLLRTTSRSESSNFYFNHFVQKGDTLTEFYICYESAIEKQRYINDKMNHYDDAKPKLITQKKIEEYAAKMYTRSIFYKIQEEIHASCGDFEIDGLNIIDGMKIYSIKDRLEKDKIFEVTFNMNTKHVECSCKLYIRVGYLCKHCFFCLTLCGIHEIPIHLMKDRWLKNAEERFSKIQIGELIDPSAEQDIRCVQANDCWFEFQSCIAEASGDQELTKIVYDGIKALKNKLREAKHKTNSKLDNCIIENLIGSKVVEEINVFPPLQSNNKGGRKRIVGSAEKSVNNKKRQKRECKTCGEMAFHDSRNCPTKTGLDPKKHQLSQKKD